MAKDVKSPLQTWGDERYPLEAPRPSNVETLAQINEALILAEHHGLQGEVVWSTINFILMDIEQGKKPIEINIGEAFEAALGEWDI